MAVSDAKKETPKTVSANREGAPAWVVPVYVGGLVLMYIGERVLSTFDSGHWIATAPGLAAVLVATATRFVPTWQAGGERGRIEKLLGILSIGGVVALAVYALTTDWGMGKLGLLTGPDQKRESVHAVLTVLWTVLVFVSVIPMLFAEAALYPQRNAERLESRRVRAAAAAGLTLALASIYGALFVYSATGSQAKVDFSYFKTSEPSESTRKLVAGLNQPIRVIGFFPEVSPVRYEVQNYLTKLAVGAPNLKVEVQDRYLQPKLAKEMKIVQDGVLVIVKGEAKRTVTVGTDMNDAAKNLKTLDRDFQERLYKLLRERRNVYLTVGHGEINDDEDHAPDKQDSGRSAQILRTLLGKQNYNVKNLGIGQGLATDVPDDTDVLMILGPTQPFSPEELASVERYAKRGGKLLMALDPDVVSTEETESEGATSPTGAPARPASLTSPKPAGSAELGAKPKPGSALAPASDALASKGTLGSLEALAAMVGVEFTPIGLANDKQFARRRFNDSDRTLLVTNRFSSHASVSTLSRNSSRAAVVVAGAGSLQRVSGSPAKVDIALRAMTNTFADVNRNYQYDEGSEKRDTFGLAAAASEPIAGSAPPAPKK
ncbi:MAG TPA: Gldg family protein, partial [Polyangiaceae bacterium]|nr:Gldg family protein [Polyangiaceae bacterium]